jgi:RimJ/RimL family protein N-acetyltransferase
MVSIRVATQADIPAFREHLLRSGKESGSGTDIIFAPYEKPWNRSLEELQKEKQEKWTRPVDDPNWERCWVITDERNIYGELKLVHEPAMSTALHRATLMMGIERSHRQQGLGTKLIQEAIQWATQEPSLDWIHLFVFSHNEPARRLYKKFGFQEVGTTPDMFRVHGKKIDDIGMVLKLRS